MRERHNSVLALLAGALLFGGLTALPGNKPRRAGAGAAAGVLVAAAAFVGPWGGERLDAYLDRIASPPVWTVCYGETRGVQQGDRYTAEECRDQLMTALAGLVTTVLLPLVTARIYRWTGVQIEQKHQKALHEAAMTWAHSATRRGIKPATKQAQDDLLAYLRKSVPDAVRALQPGAEALLRIGERYLRQAGR